MASFSTETIAAVHRQNSTRKSAANDVISDARFNTSRRNGFRYFLNESSMRNIIDIHGTWSHFPGARSESRPEEVLPSILSFVIGRCENATDVA